MKKNYRKIPNFITNRVNECNSDNIVVATILKVKSSELNKSELRNLNISFVDNQLKFEKEFMPNPKNGGYSKKNANGFKITHKDQAKIQKTFYLGERPIYGDWSKGSFSLYVTKKVYPYTKVPPKENTIKIELLESKKNSDFNVFTIKVFIDEILNKNDPEFLTKLFFNINLLQENAHSVNVFDSNADISDYLKTIYVNWEIFPPGERNSDLARITNKIKNLTKEEVKTIEDRYDFLTKIDNKVEIVYGLGGVRNYFGAKFSDKLAVFENVKYGNAIYILFENWEEYSKLSRTQLQSLPDDKYIRIIHRRNWKEQVIRIIKKRK